MIVGANAGPRDLAEQPIKDLFAVSGSLAGTLQRRFGLLGESIAESLKRRHGSVVGERPVTVRERVSVFQRLSANRRHANMSNNHLRKGAFSRRTEFRVLKSGGRSSLKHRLRVLIVADAPAVRIGSAQRILAALPQQRVLRARQRAFNLGRFTGSKGIQTAHL